MASFYMYLKAEKEIECQLPLISFLGFALWVAVAILYVLCLTETTGETPRADLFSFEQNFWIIIVSAHGVVGLLTLYAAFAEKGANVIVQSVLVGLGASITAFVAVALALGLMRAGTYGMVNETVVAQLGPSWQQQLSNSTVPGSLVSTLVQPNSALRTDLGVADDALVLYPALAILLGLIADGLLLGMLFKLLVAQLPDPPPSYTQDYKYRGLKARVSKQVRIYHQ